ncbi:MAG TPA: acyl-CoA thioesterase domain-containing protein [Aeromicrobium sp.]|nr:acyl-CoA thioesterase domain-containing protein [Aeromicrobium sp.]
MSDLAPTEFAPTEFALFRADGDVLIPQGVARSLWKHDQMHGVATSGALARAAEQAVIAAGRTDLRPARFTVDLFRAPSMDPCHLTTIVVREGSRIMLVETTLYQENEARARAIALFLRGSENPDGQVWRSDDIPQPPSLDIAPETDQPRVPFFFSDRIGWSQNFAEHQNSDRKATWQSPIPVVAGEKTSPFQGLAGMADSTSMVCNWGDQGVQYINTDVNLSISRLPVSHEVGLAALTWNAHDGIAIGSAIVFDREGPFGTSMVTSLANARRSVDFTKFDFGDADDQSFSTGA